MRRTTIFALIFLVLLLAGLMGAAHLLLDTFEPEIELARELTDSFAHRQEIHPGSRVRVVRRQDPQSGQGAAEGWGLVVHLDPAASVRADPGRLRVLLSRLGQEATARSSDRALDWIEVRIPRAHAQVRGAEFRCRLRRGPDGDFLPPEPPLPPEGLPASPP